MCIAFPRIGKLIRLKILFLYLQFLYLSASCDYWRWGSGGRQESINAICILALNIINDKARFKQMFANISLFLFSFSVSNQSGEGQCILMENWIKISPEVWRMVILNN